MRSLSRTKLESPREEVLVSRYTANMKCRGSDKGVGTRGVYALCEPQTEQRGMKQSLKERWLRTVLVWYRRKSKVLSKYEQTGGIG